MPFPRLGPWASGYYVAGIKLWRCLPAISIVNEGSRARGPLGGSGRCTRLKHEIEALTTWPTVTEHRGLTSAGNGQATFSAQQMNLVLFQRLRRDKNVFGSQCEMEVLTVAAVKRRRIEICTGTSPSTYTIYNVQPLGQADVHCMYKQKLNHNHKLE